MAVPRYGRCGQELTSASESKFEVSTAKGLGAFNRFFTARNSIFIAPRCTGPAYIEHGNGRMHRVLYRFEHFWRRTGAPCDRSWWYAMRDVPDEEGKLGECVVTACVSRASYNRLDRSPS